MVITLTKEQQEKVKSGELTIAEIIKQEGQQPEQDTMGQQVSELQKTKEDLKKANQLYAQAIIDNRQIRSALQINVKEKAQLRDIITQLREKKKELM